MDEESHARLLGRREFGALAIAAAALPRGACAATTIPASPTLEFVFEACVQLGAPADRGARGDFVPITGGTFSGATITGGTVAGPDLQGVVLPGGGDWQGLGDDGATVIHARCSLRASDGTVIWVDNPGVRVASPRVIARLSAGEDLDPSLYYFRTTPSFKVAPGPHDWLRRSVFVCHGTRHPSSVALRVFRVT